MSFCIAISFAALYLQWLHYTNTELGLIMALGNLLGAGAGTLVSSLIDRYERFSARRLVPYLLSAQALSLTLLAAFPVKGALTSAGFVLLITFCISVNSLNLKLYVDFEHVGIPVNYSFSRGVGSLSFVLLSVFLGIITEKTSARILPFAGLLMCLLQLVSHLLLCRVFPALTQKQKSEPKKGVSLLQFALLNRRYCVLLLGTVFIFCAHNIVFNFLINVTDNVGGGADTMGYLNGFMAAVEIPVMMLYTKFFGRKETSSALKISFVFFSLKGIAIAASFNILTLFAAVLLQAPSFALYSAVIVPYVSKTISYENSAKAQSLAFSMTQIGSVLASLLGGILYDNTTVTATLWISCAVCALGTVVSIFGVTPKRSIPRT